MAIVKCPHCGESTPDTTLNCINCGKDINSPPNDAPLFKDSESNNIRQTPSPNVKKERMNKILYSTFPINRRLKYSMNPVYIFSMIISILMIAFGLFSYIIDEVDIEYAIEAIVITNIRTYKSVIISTGIALLMLTLCLNSIETEIKRQTNVLLELFEDD